MAKHTRITEHERQLIFTESNVLQNLHMKILRLVYLKRI